MKVQKYCTRWVLQPLADLADKIPLAVRKAMALVSGVLLCCLYFCIGMEFLTCRYLYVYTAGCLLIGIAVLCSMPKKIEVIKWRKSFLIPWLIFGGLTLISGIVNQVDYLPEAMLVLVGYPIVWIIWNNRGCESVFPWVIRVVRCSFWIYFGISLFFFPMTEVRYSGMIRNVNGCSEYLTTVFACVFADMLSQEKWGKKCYDLVILGLSASLTLYTASRTGLLCIIMIVGVVGILSLIRADKQRRQMAISLGLLVAVTGLFFYTNVYVFRYAYEVTSSVKNAVVELFVPQDGQSGEKVPPFGEGEDSKEPNIGSAVDQYNELIDRFSSEGKSVDAISTGRISLIKQEIKLLNLFGHSEKPNLEANGNRKYSNAHNAIVDYAYESGIFAGLAYLVVCCVLGVASISVLWKNKTGLKTYIPISVSMNFAVICMLASPRMSFWYFCLLVSYLGITPLVTQNVSQKTDETIS